LSPTDYTNNISQENILTIVLGENIQ